MGTPQYTVISVEKQGSVDWLTLDRGDGMNALNRVMITELTDYFTRLYRDESTRIVVLKAAGKNFCVGLDLVEFRGVNGNPEANFRLQTDVRDIMRAMRNCPQPIISLLHGAVCGGGFSLALASDIRIASHGCRMNAAFIRIGLGGCDMGSSYFLPRLVGGSVASELLLTGRFIEADRALRVNLVSDVVARDDMPAAAGVLIDDMLQTAPMGLRLTKQGLNLGVDAPSMDAAMALEDRQQILLGQTDDHKEAVNAFFEKRPAVFK